MCKAYAHTRRQAMCLLVSGAFRCLSCTQHYISTTRRKITQATIITTSHCKYTLWCTCTCGLNNTQRKCAQANALSQLECLLFNNNNNNNKKKQQKGPSGQLFEALIVNITTKQHQRKGTHTLRIYTCININTWIDHSKSGFQHHWICSTSPSPQLWKANTPQGTNKSCTMMFGWPFQPRFM